MRKLHIHHIFPALHLPALFVYSHGMKLYFASGNDHKRQEMSRLLGGYELVLPKDEGIAFDPDEDGSTYIENAMIKAKALWDIVHQPVLSDDSGLSVRALGGRPGIHSARYGEEDGRKLSSEEKYMLLLRNMEGIEDRSASFIAALCLMLDEERIYIIQERCAGRIAMAPLGAAGFGYDPVFIIEEAGMTAADLPAEDKDRYSHRGKAARRMGALLERELEGIRRNQQ